MRATITRGNGEKREIEADWSVIPSGYMKELRVTCFMDSQYALQLMLAREIFTLRMNDGREAKVWVRKLDPSSAPGQLVRVSLSLSAMIRENPI
jgi:hypothetical protein